MGIRYSATIGTMIGAALLVLWATLACGQVDHERVAEDVARERAMTEAEAISEEKEGHKRIAEAVAREWAMTEADGISEEIAAMATRSIRAFIAIEMTCDSSSVSCVATSGKEPYEERIPMAADSGQIRETIRWEFGPPNRKADGHYEIIATASISFDVAPSELGDVLRQMPDLVPDLRMPFGGSVDYTLEIDTTSREVRKANIPLASVRLTEMLPEGILN